MHTLTIVFSELLSFIPCDDVLGRFVFGAWANHVTAMGRTFTTTAFSRAI